LLAAFALPAPAQESARDRERELARIRAEIRDLSAKLERARRQRSDLAGQLAATDLELRLHQRRLAEAGAARALLSRQAEASAQEVERLAASLDATRRDLARRLSGLYRLGRQGYLRLLLSARPGERLLPSIRLVRYLAQRDRVAIDRYAAARRRLARERDLLLARRAALEGWIGREEARRRELARARERQAVLLARLAREGQALALRAGELAERERKLSAFLDVLYGRSADPLSGAPMQGFRGVLDWPARGRVTAGFGPLLDPRYRTRVPHNGLDIETRPGVEVRAVYPGQVLFAAPFEGYGTAVVVLHPGRMLTLYAGLSELRVGREGMVTLGQVVGLASERLYFEIRVENRPEDPLTWLR
jgi:septal ring factor EnvC (AmiA/AmiB activator)